MKHLLSLISMMILAGDVAAQDRSFSFETDTTSATGSISPTFTWATEPDADCVASGGWSGDRPPEGSEQVDTITETTDFTFECAWAGNRNVTLHWLNPTEYDDGSPYDDPGETIIRYRLDGDPRHQQGAGLTVDETLADCGDGLDDVWCISGIDPTFTTYTLTSLEPGEWTFVAHSCTAEQVCSQASPPATTTVIEGETIRKTLTIRISRIPRAPQALEVE